MIIMNTKFKKQNEKLATYRRIGATIGDEIQRPTHEQLDYIITTYRWKNTTLDAESDTQANIDSDHYPVKAKLRIQLKGIKKTQIQRDEYKQCTKEENEKLNEIFKARMEIQKRKREEQINIEDKIRTTQYDLPTTQKRAITEPMSRTTEHILEQRNIAMQNRNPE